MTGNLELYSLIASAISFMTAWVMVNIQINPTMSGWKSSSFCQSLSLQTW